MVFRVISLPLLGTKVTDTVQRPFLTPRILALPKAQYFVPPTMLMRNLPWEVFGIVIETALAIFAALTVRPRRRYNFVTNGFGVLTDGAVELGLVVVVCRSIVVVVVVVVVTVVVVVVVVVVGTTLRVLTSVAV